MSSDTSQSPENGSASLEDMRIKKNLKSAVIADDDKLKIKLKISRTELNKKESLVDVKGVKTSRNVLLAKSELRNGDEKSGGGLVLQDEDLVKISNAGEPKMKLRSKREADEDGEHKKLESEDGAEEKRLKEYWNEKEVEKPWKKRKKTIKYRIDNSPEKVEEGSRRRSKRNEGEAELDKSMETIEEAKEVNKESFCWTCHKDGSVVRCDTCPRVFHLKCVSLTKDPSKDWICPECSLVLHAEKMSTRSEAMKSLSLDQLCTLLSFAIGRMKNVPESEAFWKPVDPKEVPYYDKYITNPMDLNLLEKNMKAKMYGSPQAFLADAKWLLHNSIIFNSNQSPLTSTARFLVKICRQEMAEIENCPDCYLNAHTKDEWFIEVCRKPHILIWARLKGFPFWPAKAMSTNLKTQQVDARFFGAHDKAWVPVKECYLYSKNSPQVLSKKRADLDDAFMEVEGYIKKIRQKYGVFCYAPDKTPFMPEMYDKQLQSMIPTYKDEKTAKKKRKSDQSFEENGTVDKPCQNGKKVAGQVTPQRHQLKRQASYDAPKVLSDVCHMPDYVSEEKVINDDGISPEDEIAKSLEMFDTHKKVEEVLDENPSDLDDDASLPIPEHGYSRNSENLDVVQSSSTLSEVDNKSADISEEQEEKLIENSTPVDGKTQNTCESECVAESSDVTKDSQKVTTEEKKASLKAVNDQCEVSSTSADLKVAENEDHEDVNEQRELDSSGVDDKSDVKSGANCQEPENDCKEKSGNIESGKKDDERSQKSFVNLTCDQKQKILTEAKLLANIDELSALGKQKVLNELGLDASKVDIRQLAQENRQILETLNKKRQNEGKGFEEVSIKNEDFEQYLMEENNEENIFEEDLAPNPPQLASIRMRDFHMLSKDKDKGSSEPVVQIVDVHSLRELGQTTVEQKSKRKKSFDDPAKKLKLEPVVELIRLDPFDKSVSRLNRKLRLSDEVSLMMVDGEKRVNVNVGAESVEPEAHKSVKKTNKAVRARKGLPNRAKSSSREISKNINIISVDTENSTAQKNLLKSLCLEEKKPEESVRKTVLITTNEKGIKNVDFKSSCEPTIKKQIKEITIEAVKDSVKGNEMIKEGNSSSQKNLAAMTNSHLIVTNSCPTIVANQNGQPNLALAQNNTGQLSLVHLSNLTSGIQTNFVNLTNETIGFNPVGTLVSPLVATSGLKSEYPSNSGMSSVILNPNPTTSLPSSTGNGSASKGGKSGGDSNKLSVNRVGSSKLSSGISVKSPNSLGLNASQASNLLSFVTPQGEGVSFTGDLGPVTADLNKHSMKMAEHMRAVIEDMLRELSNQGSLEAKYKLLTIEMEKLQWRHQQEILEMKHHSGRQEFMRLRERSMMELRTSLETEKQKCLGELKAQLESQHQKVISETKRKQWCANCGKEALFYCCWNTSYCDYPCQQRHWPGHMNTCAQLGNNVTLGNSTGSQLQSKTPGIKYQNSNYVPNMSRGGSVGGERSGSGHGTVTSCNTGNGGGSMSTNRSIPAVQVEAHMRRSSDPSLPALPVNITIRPQHYFM